MTRRWSIVEWALAALLLPGVAACGRPSGYERYVPSAERAHEALDQVLAAWKSGETVESLTLKSAPITVRVADSTRRPGQRLVAYDLLGEVSGEGPRTFVVRLKLDDPSDEQEVRYYLVGIDPLWVFRQEDYDAVAHWDACAGAEEGSRETERRRDGERGRESTR
ncbi:MAG: hypothetical protein B7Z73_14755 [Planctomycetia bacterium 21-64-5]|nr:MAG: hypothetical protein B7Z73_14755 [Planctomycetia bacterium 21-64-5]HQU47215.1 hypothetical protein [Pirellulales bacterium]